MAVVSVPITFRARVRARSPRPVAIRRARAALGLAVLAWLVVFVAAGLGTSDLPADSGGSVRVSGRTHVVERGETLWSIATAEGAAAGVDPRVAVEELAALNHLSGAEVRAGQALVLP